VKAGVSLAVPGLNPVLELVVAVREGVQDNRPGRVRTEGVTKPVTATTTATATAQTYAASPGPLPHGSRDWGRPR
jgi:hypothetical protein